MVALLLEVAISLRPGKLSRVHHLLLLHKGKPRCRRRWGIWATTLLHPLVVQEQMLLEKRLLHLLLLQNPCQGLLLLVGLRGP